MLKSFWIYCEHCKRRLIQRNTGGLFYFRFGKPVSVNENGEKKLRNMSTPVEMMIHGSLKMRCWHRDCKKWNTLNFFPVSDKKEKTISSSAESGKRRSTSK